MFQWTEIAGGASYETRSDEVKNGHLFLIFESDELKNGHSSLIFESDELESGN